MALEVIKSFRNSILHIKFRNYQTLKKKDIQEKKFYKNDPM